MINTLKYSKTLQAAGVPPEQAEAYIFVMAEFVEGNLASKEDVRRLGHENMPELRNELIAKIQEVRSDLRTEIQDLRHEIRQLEHRMTIKLGTIVTLALAALTAIHRFF